LSIEVEKLVKRYGSVTAVREVSLSVAEGEFVSLLGPSGCGKTTTLRCIAGLEEADGGTIRIGGRVVSAPAEGLMVPPRDRGIGMVFQSYAIWPHMTVAGNVGFALRMRGQKQNIEREVDTALEVVGLRHLRDRQPSQLSGGQQQRVALARAIIGSPKILLFDEPLSNLDAKLRESTRGEIRRLQRELNVAALYVTHDQEEALSMSDRVIVMDTGVVMQAGTPTEIYRRPENRFTAEFVGRASFFEVVPEGDRWRMPDGTPVRAAVAPAVDARPRQAMLRPEAIEMLPAEPAPDDPERNVLFGAIRERQFVGPVSDYVVEAGGAPLRTRSAIDFEAGQVVALAFHPVDTRIVAD
jgi:ABC-type Fe3+/spermidine/putrescine transport system ATPase subunit